jgi:hypothetical protein
VTTGGGGASEWRADGRAITIGAPDFKSISTCDVITAPTFHATAPRLLFRLPEGTLGGASTTDLRRFLLTVQEGNSSPTTITVALDWASQLEKR